MSYQLETTEDGGNLVIFDSDGNIIWSTGNEDVSHEQYAEVSDDGNLYLYGYNGGLSWRARKYKSRSHLNKN